MTRFAPSVVPWTACATSESATDAARSTSARPRKTASEGSRGVVSCLPTNTSPVSAFWSTKSVNVPPISNPSRQVMGDARTASAKPRQSSIPARSGCRYQRSRQLFKCESECFHRRPIDDGEPDFAQWRIGLRVAELPDDTDRERRRLVNRKTEDPGADGRERDRTKALAVRELEGGAIGLLQLPCFVTGVPHGADGVNHRARRQPSGAGEGGTVVAR